MSSYKVPNRLNGKVAIVTGSSYGIGFSIARRLAREGAKVIICSRNEKNVENAIIEMKKEGLDVTGISCHVAKSEDRKKLFQASEKLGGLDILVSNVAVNPEVKSIFDASESAWDKILDVNLKSAFMLAKESIPQLRKSKSGRIVFISSAIGYTSSDILGVYSISKAALFSLTKTGAIHLAKDGITVNCIAPGLIKTNFAKVITGNEGYAHYALSRIPLGRFAEVDEVSGVVAFLASEDASYITGETIVVAGGLHCRL